MLASDDTQSGLIEEALRGIAARGLFLEEILEVGGARPEGPHEPVLPPALDPERVLERWRFACSQGDPASFGRRLAWDGLDEKAAHDRLALAPRSIDGPLPPWAATLGEILHDLLRPTPESRRHEEAFEIALRSLKEPRAAFQAAWIPWVGFATRRLSEAAPSIFEEARPTAIVDLQLYLVDQLSRIADGVLYEQFDGRRQGEEIAGREGRTGYDAFLDFLRRGGWIPLLGVYSALARQLARIVETWIASSASMFLRLRADREAIERDILGGGPPGMLARIDCALSDRHHGGQRVAILSFEGGSRLVYKPRDVRIDEAFQGFLEWLAGEGLSDPPSAMKILSRGRYGWVEWIAQTPGSSEADASRFYRQAGSLLCLAHLFGAHDLHMDNLVAGPRGPVLIDLESLMQPERATMEGPAAARSGSGREAPPRDSCLSSGLLAFPRIDPLGRPYDIGGLCGEGGHLRGESLRAWRDLHTDRMHPEGKPAFAPPEKNLLLLHGRAEPVERHREDLCAGFEETYRLLLSRRDRLDGDDGFLRRFDDLPLRLILRDSSAYASVQSALLAPEFQKLGWIQSVVAETLHRPFAELPARPAWWKMAALERRGLLDLDIPYFLATTSGRDLLAGDGSRASGFLERSAIETTLDRLRGLHPAALAGEVDAIHLAIPDDRAGSPSPWRRITAPASGAGAGPAWVDPYLRCAFAIAETVADDLRARLETMEAGRSSCASAEPAAWPERHLYEGTMGTALLLAYAAESGGPAVLGETALAACADVERLLRGAAGAFSGRKPLGACNGMGGILYALASIGALLDSPGPTEIACRLVELFTRESLDAAEIADVESGIAGAILGLLALHADTGDPSVLERARLCGDWLLARATRLPAGGIGWESPDGPALAGFAHGASGIGYALARLYGSTRQEAYREGALEAFRFEQGLFDPVRRDWPVLVAQGESAEPARVFMSAWCHGAPGVALARAASLPILGERSVREELVAAMETALRSGFSHVDHLCCGNMGRFDVYLTAAERLGDRRVLRSAGDRSRIVVQRALDRGEFTLDDLDRTRRPSGLFRGLSGIAYGLIRLSRQQGPSILAFEPFPRRGGAAGG